MSDLADPSVQALKAERLAELRQRAATRLPGAGAAKGSPARAADALTVLFSLASSPETAKDALTLMHELQVHQVEIDLQAQELLESRSELEAALRRQVARYHGLPVGCFTLDARTVVLELNETAAGMLGLARDDAVGLSLGAFLDAEGADRLRSVIGRVGAAAPGPSVRLVLQPRLGPARAVLASVAMDAEANRYLVGLTACAVDEPPGRAP